MLFLAQLQIRLEVNMNEGHRWVDGPHEGKPSSGYHIITYHYTCSRCETKKIVREDSWDSVDRAVTTRYLTSDNAEVHEEPPCRW